MITTTRLDIYSILLLISIGQLLILMLTLTNQAKKNKNGLLLIIVFFIFTLNIIEPVFIHTRFILKVPYLLYIGPAFLLLFGPSLFLYVLSIQNKSFKWKFIYLVHLLPFLFIKLKNLPLFFQSLEQKMETIKHFLDYETSNMMYNPSLNLIDVLFLLHPIVYCFIGGFIIIKELNKAYSRFNNSHLIFIGSLTFVFSFYLLGRYFLKTLGISPYNEYWRTLAILMFLFVCLSSYLIINKLLEPLNFKKQLKKDPEAIKIYKTIKTLMIEDELFLNSKISLVLLANELNITPRFLSKIINEFEQINFPEFINGYRIEKAKKLILDPKMKNYTIEAIATEAGFTNKMTFNRTFKKKTSLTPSEYKSSVNK